MRDTIGVLNSSDPNHIQRFVLPDLDQIFLQRQRSSSADKEVTLRVENYFFYYKSQSPMTNRFFRGTTWNHCIFTETLLNNPNIQFMYTMKCRMTSTYRIFSIALVVYAASDIGGVKSTLWLSS